MIPFNKPHLTGEEFGYIQDAVNSGHLSGNGKYTRLCHAFFKERFGFGKCLLTTSCTDALEMAAILLDIKEGDEVIMPSYTFVSTANAFALRKARIVFVDSREDCPNMDESQIEALITKKTKAIVPVHYAGVACDMGAIMKLADKYGLFVVEDAAQAIDSYYVDPAGNKRALGSIGHLATFSFHETKNIISGEGGMLVINDPRFYERAEIIWEKGTNRSAFFRNEVNKYEWVDVGSSFLPSEIIASFLYAQLKALKVIQQQRQRIWNTYYNELKAWAMDHQIQLPIVPEYATNNAHLFYMVSNGEEQRDFIIKHLRNNGVLAIFHYISLHKSPFYSATGDVRVLKECEHYSDALIRLPLFYGLSKKELHHIVNSVRSVRL
ncbi:dTDP-4-amino-4,6-dideoxygalactose transaminase [Spongiimicrobium sp. 2-473A-2-J]|uniref:dTDP-4-amino-4,6-dideoxygalactose transaminase n=1 Tax=Eudoraea algarum TaxID=3417568 RepID=UPI003D36C106